jgi:hypothetical protein
MRILPRTGTRVGQQSSPAKARLTPSSSFLLGRRRMRTMCRATRATTRNNHFYQGVRCVALETSRDEKRGNRKWTMSMSSSPILQEKRAIIFGAGGSIGAAVAKEFEVRRFFSRPHQIEGRRRNEAIHSIRRPCARGSHKHPRGRRRNEYIDGAVKQTGRIDIVFDAVGPLVNEHGNGKTLWIRVLKNLWCHGQGW